MQSSIRRHVKEVVGSNEAPRVQLSPLKCRDIGRSLSLSLSLSLLCFALGPLSLCFALLCSGARRKGSPLSPLCRAAPSTILVDELKCTLRLTNDLGALRSSRDLHNNCSCHANTPWVPSSFGAGALRYKPPFLPQPCLYPERKPDPRALTALTFHSTLNLTSIWCPFFHGFSRFVLLRLGHFRLTKSYRPHNDM